MGKKLAYQLEYLISHKNCFAMFAIRAAYKFRALSFLDPNRTIKP